MRTTLDIDDDVLMAVREIARRRKQSVGKVVSELVRHSLLEHRVKDTRNGVLLFPVRPDGRVVTLELINGLRDEME